MTKQEANKLRSDGWIGAWIDENNYVFRKDGSALCSGNKIGYYKSISLNNKLFQAKEWLKQRCKL